MKVTKSVHSKKRISVRTELLPQENTDLEVLLKVKGQKKGWWIRQAILERYAREIKEIDC